MRKPLFAAVSYVVLSCVAVFLTVPCVSAGTLNASRGVDIVQGDVTNAPTGRVVFADTFAPNGIWESQPLNYENRLHISFGTEYRGAKCLVVSGANLQKIDTAWSVTSKPIPLTGSAESFSLVLSACSDKLLGGTATSLQSRSWRNAIAWLDAAGKPCGEQSFNYTIPSGGFGEIVVHGPVPAAAKALTIQLGFDVPNVDQGNILAFRDLEFALVDSATAFTKEGWFESKIFAGGDVKWTAETPHGTSVKFQLATAGDRNGEPGEWSRFLGPDGTDKTYYTGPFTTRAPFVRYRAVLVPSGRERPRLTSVTVGNVTDRNWTRRHDGFPPRVKIASETPSRNRLAELALSITDDAPVRWKSLRIAVDDREATGQFARSGSRLVFKPKEPWTEGLHTVNVDVEDYYGNAVKAKKCFFIGDTPKTAKITLRDDGMTLIDGKPFFPIGLYGVMKREFNNFDLDKAFKDLKAAGFNFAHSYSMPRSDEFLAAALKYDFKLWTVARFPDERFISVERHHPAIIAWYLGDDTSANTTPSELYDRDDAVKAVDPTRITTQADGVAALGAISNYYDYVNGTDNFLPEIYPVHTMKPQDGEGCVARTIVDMERCRADIAAIGSGTRSLWPIIQYFKGWGWQRFPTMQELRGMSFASIIHGAHGITWYTYGGTVVPEKKKFNYGVTTTPETWNNISTVATQIKTLVPVLIERTPKEQPTVQLLTGPAKDPYDNPSVTCLLKRHEGYTYLLTVNASPAEVRASFALPGTVSGEVLFEDRAVRLTDGKLVDTFAGHDVHIYKLK